MSVTEDTQYREYNEKAKELTYRLGATDVEREILATRFLFYVYGANPDLAMRAMDFTLERRVL